MNLDDVYEGFENVFRGFSDYLIFFMTFTAFSGLLGFEIISEFMKLKLFALIGFSYMVIRIIELKDNISKPIEKLFNKIK